MIQKQKISSTERAKISIQRIHFKCVYNRGWLIVTSPHRQRIESRLESRKYLSLLTTLAQWYQTMMPNHLPDSMLCNNLSLIINRTINHQKNILYEITVEACSPLMTKKLRCIGLME